MWPAEYHTIHPQNLTEAIFYQILWVDCVMKTYYFRLKTVQKVKNENLTAVLHSDNLCFSDKQAVLQTVKGVCIPSKITERYEKIQIK